MRKYIKEFHLMNVKNVEQWTADINGRHFALCGKNKTGKTTRFQIIRRLLASMPEGETPVWVREGENGAVMHVRLVSNGDTYVVEEKVSPGSRSRIRLWKITDDDTWTELSPAQGLIKQIFGSSVDFTPLINMSGAKQFEFLQKNLGFDMSGYISHRKTLSQNRATAKTRKQVVEALMADTRVSKEDLDAYAKEKSVDEILAKRVDILSLEEDRIAAQLRLDQVEAAKDTLGDIDEQIAALQNKKRSLREKIKGEQAVRDKLTLATGRLSAGEAANAAVEQELQSIAEYNHKCKMVAYYNEKLEELVTEEGSVEALNKNIKRLDTEFRNSLAAFPFDDIHKGLRLAYQPADKELEQEEQVGLYIGNLPFNESQFSYSECIKILIRLSVEVNPEGLNFVYISKWNEFDAEGKNEIIRFANAQGNVQLGVEKVDENTEVSIEFIEDAPLGGGGLPEDKPEPKKAAKKKVKSVGR